MTPFKFLRKYQAKHIYQSYIIDILREHGSLNRDWRARKYFFEDGIERSIRITGINPYPDRTATNAIIAYMVEHVPSFEYMDERRNEANAIFTGRTEITQELFKQLIETR